MLELVLISVPIIEHLAHESIGHRIARAARELVEDLFLVDHGDIDAVDGAVHVGKSLSLLKVGLSGNDEHIGSSQTMQVLILNRLIGSDLLQRFCWIKGHIQRPVGGR